MHSYLFFISSVENMNLLQHCGWCPGRTSTVGQSFASQFQTNNLVAYSKPNLSNFQPWIRTFRYLAFWEKKPKKKTHSLPGKYTLSPDGCAGWWFNTIQTMKRPGSGVQFAGEISMVNSIILVAEFPVCFYQTIFCQLNPMFFLSEIPFC